MTHTNWWEDAPSGGGSTDDAGGTAGSAVDRPTIDTPTIDEPTVPTTSATAPHDRQLSPSVPTGNAVTPGPGLTGGVGETLTSAPGGDPDEQQVSDPPAMAVKLAFAGVACLVAYVGAVLALPMTYERSNAFDSDPDPVSVSEQLQAEIGFGNADWWMVGTCIAAVVAAAAGMRALRGRTTWLLVLAAISLLWFLGLSMRPYGDGHALLLGAVDTHSAWAVTAIAAAAAGLGLLFGGLALAAERQPQRALRFILAVASVVAGAVIASGTVRGDPAVDMVAALEPMEFTRCETGSTVGPTDVDRATLILAPALGGAVVDENPDNPRNLDPRLPALRATHEFVGNDWRLIDQSGPSLDLHVEIGWPFCPELALYADELGPTVVALPGLAAVPGVRLFGDGYALYVDGRVVVAASASLDFDGDFMYQDPNPGREGDMIARWVNNALAAAGSAMQIEAVP